MISLLIAGILGIVGAIVAGSINKEIATENNVEAATREATARQENYQYNEMAAQNAQTRQMQMQDYLQQMEYKRFYDLESPKAVIQQLKDAGMSPSAYLEGAGGAGGSSIPTAPIIQGNGTSGISPQTAFRPPMSYSDLANTALINSQARLNNAQADEIEGKTEPAQARMIQVLSDAGVKDAQKEFIKVQTSINQTQDEIIKATKNTEIKKALYECSKTEREVDLLYWQVADAKVGFEFDNETFEDRKKSITAYNAKVLAEGALTEAQTKLAETERYKLEAEISRIYNDMWVSLTNTNVNEMNAETYQNWINAQIPTLREQLDLKAKELQLENKRLWVNAGLDLFKTAGHSMGLLFMGKGGKGGMPNNPVFYGTPQYGGKNAASTWNAGKYQGLDWYGD